jgi:hypothetical protein
MGDVMRNDTRESTYEEKVDDIAKALMNAAGGWWTTSDSPTPPSAQVAKNLWRARARIALSAIGIEPPRSTWPTDETLREVLLAHNRDTLRGALCRNDPIIKAAQALREGNDVTAVLVEQVVDAVIEAGL